MSRDFFGGHRSEASPEPSRKQSRLGKPLRFLRTPVVHDVDEPGYPTRLVAWAFGFRWHFGNLKDPIRIQCLPREMGWKRHFGRLSLLASRASEKPSNPKCK